MSTNFWRKRYFAYAAAVFGIVALTGTLKSFGSHINPTTVALAFVGLILLVATAWGSGPAVVASLLGMLCFNFFFLPPFGTFTIRDPDNWIAFVAFIITAITVGQLSARARRRAEEAEAGETKIKQLYEELQEAFERASEAEALRKSERLKSALLDAVTHDIRTPLTSIKASATLLLEDREGSAGIEKLSADEQAELLKVITHGADRLDRFVEGMVDLARIDAGDMTLYRNWGAVEEIIDAALAQAEPLTRNHKIKIRAADELPIVRVDARAVTEVIYTLLDNASKHAPRYSAITIEVQRVADDVIEITIEDEGPGIPPTERDRVFERFYRGAANERTAGHAGGIGLGLAIAKGIVEAHGGRIWIADPKSGHGARVVFTVPVGDDDAPQAATEQIMSTVTG